MPVSKDILLTHIDYTRWASERLLEAASSIPQEEMERDLGSSYGGIFGTFTHIYQGDRIWLSRFERQPLMTLAEANDALTFADLRAKWPPLLKRFYAWVEQADPEAILDYHSLKGDPYSVPRWQALLHVVNHGTYHRGQIVTMMRQLGHKPVFTDLIYYFLKVE